MADKPNSVEVLKHHAGDLGAAFSALRGAAAKAGPLDAKTLELCLLSGYIVGRMEGGYKTHAKRALDLGATPAEIIHATAFNLGANAPLEAVADALGWADEVVS